MEKMQGWGDIEQAHESACAAKKGCYADPRNPSLQVFTSYYLSQRPCCGCGCRHCPYKPKTFSPRGPRMLHLSMEDVGSHVDILFWSGGKDSFLAWRRMKAAGIRDVVLLTTYDAATSQVGHQNVSIKDVVRQAEKLEVALLGVPVGGMDYTCAVRAGIKKMEDDGIEIERIAFGDLHLEDVRDWRERHLGAFGFGLHYPLWGAGYGALLEELGDCDVTVRISAVSEEGYRAGVRVGERYNRAFVQRLPSGIDGFGEKGEFHTLVEIGCPKKAQGWSSRRTGR